MRDSVTAGDALRTLQEGNQRWTTGRPKHPHLHLEYRRVLAMEGQRPIATVIGCSDSRCPVELVFDTGVGDLFVVRSAGAVCDEVVIGSVEFSVARLDAPLVVVLGHTNCGAVLAAASDAPVSGPLSAITERIAPSFRRARMEHPGLALDDIVDVAVRHNVWHTVQALFTESSIIPAAVREGRLTVVGAIVDLSTGAVEWLGRHPMQAALAMR